MSWREHLTPAGAFELKDGGRLVRIGNPARAGKDVLPIAVGTASKFSCVFVDQKKARQIAYALLSFASEMPE